jgi:hypothetical protein
VARTALALGIRKGMDSARATFAVLDRPRLNPLGDELFRTELAAT